MPSTNTKHSQVCPRTTHRMPAPGPSSITPTGKPRAPLANVLALPGARSRSRPRVHVHGLRALTAAFALVTGLAAGVATTSFAHARSAPSLYAMTLQARQLEGTININTASAEQLELLPGIGPATAKKVMAYREKHPFKEAIHLQRIKGIGRKTFQKLKPFVRVEGPTTLHEVDGS